MHSTLISSALSSSYFLPSHPLNLTFDLSSLSSLWVSTRVKSTLVILAYLPPFIPWLLIYSFFVELLLFFFLPLPSLNLKRSNVTLENFFRWSDAQSTTSAQDFSFATVLHQFVWHTHTHWLAQSTLSSLWLDEEIILVSIWGYLITSYNLYPDVIAKSTTTSNITKNIINNLKQFCETLIRSIYW